MRIALGQVDTTVGDLPGNVDLLTAWASRATEADADVVVFPELAITGYPPEDLVMKPGFVADNAAALAKLAARTRHCAAIVGDTRNPLWPYAIAGSKILANGSLPSLLCSSAHAETAPGCPRPPGVSDGGRSGSR